MTETKEHLELKNMAKTMLVNMGFSLKEIHEEYRVDINTVGSGRSFRVDVCGIPEKKYSGRKAVAIECGKTDGEKLVNLNLFFDEVYHLPYGIKKVDDFDKVYEDAITDINALRETVTKLKRKILDLEQKNRSLNERINRWLKAETLILALDKMLFPNKIYYTSSDEKRNKIIQLLDDMG